MKSLFLKLLEELSAGRSAVLLTIIDTMGSTPRGAGSHQLILEDGSAPGTVGGGYQEHLACEAGRKALREKTSFILPLVLHKDSKADIGAVCGGELRVFCQYFDRSVPSLMPLLDRTAQCLAGQQACRLFWDLTDPAHWGMALFTDDGLVCCGQSSYLQHLPEEPGRDRKMPGMVSLPGHSLYKEILAHPRHVIVFGGGHVAKALVPLLTGLDFSCTVVEDRSEFISASRFPDAAARITADFHHLADYVPVSGDDYVCIMTRGHLGDYDAQKYALSCHPCYIGVIGSRAKLAFVRSKLLADGFSADAIDACHAPIGLPISAATPEEIAVSIAAELIAVRARREGREKKDAKVWRAYRNEHYRI